MGCRVRYLNSTGIMRREIKGIEALANAFPSEWLFYVALNCYPKGQDPMEIDAFIVMDDRVLLLEIKDWNGKLTNQNDRWYIGGQSRGRSAVIVANEKAKKLKSLLCNEIPQIKSNLYIDSRVILTASSTKDKLPDAEKPYVWTLLEACSIATPAKRTQLLKSVRLSLIKLYQFEKEFDKVTGNTKIFQPLEADWNGFKVIEQDVFVHPREIWRDHFAERTKESRLKAVVRSWSFDKLPVSLNSSDRRQLIANRETKAIAHLSALASSVTARNLILQEATFSNDDILTNHFEVRSIASGMHTLDRYLEKMSEDLTDADRILLATRLINLISQLHHSAIAHRDIGPRCIWVGGNNAIAITGLMSCQMPDEESVVDWLTTLRGYSQNLPEDKPNSTPSSGTHRDVFLTGYLVALILTGDKKLTKSGEFTALPMSFSFLNDWLEKATSNDPMSRFNDAISMENEFTELVESVKKPSIDQSILDRFETPIIPYQKWMTKDILTNKGNCTVYTSEGELENVYTVKVWNGIMRGISTSTDLALIRLLDSTAKVMNIPVNGLPKFVEVGFSKIGPFVVYQYQPGIPLNELAELDDVSAIEIGIQLISIITALHDLGCNHGDISFGNAIYDQPNKQVYLLDPFDISPVGDGVIRTPVLCPENWERLSQQSLDRYATLKIIITLLDGQSNSNLNELKLSLKREIERPVVESLEFVAFWLKKTLEELSQPPIAVFDITTSTDIKGFNTSSEKYYLSRRIINEAITRYSITNDSGQLQLEGTVDKISTYLFNPSRFITLAHESVSGISSLLKINLYTGTDSGFDTLYKHLQSLLIPPDSMVEAEEVQIATRFDVTRHWQRLIDLETNDRVEIEITEIVAIKDNTSIYQYVNIGRNFDFDPTETVDVYLNSTKKIGEIEHSLSDFSGTVGIRGLTRTLSLGDRIQLIDRREQASIDRRSKAVKRILDGQSAIPNLIKYFYQDSYPNKTNFELSVTNEQLDSYGLNEGQNQAFRELLKFGPVGLLQGPPGTGKTRFIAAFVHWLVTKGGNQRVLIASQSHEAVNNVIESLLGLFKLNGGQPNLLRIGSKGITERIRPFHTAELRERYRVRFESAERYRYTQLTSAKGINRDFAQDIYDLDSQVGKLARRCANLLQLSQIENDLLSEDRARNQNQLNRVQSSLLAAAKQILGYEIDVSLPMEELEVGFNQLLKKHTNSSPGDLNAALELLKISHEWLSSLASPQRNFEEFLAKTRNVVTATCVGVGQTRIRIESQVFDWVIVDEAARCTPSELAVPIQLGRRVLLVGDHLQLKPMIGRGVIDQLEDEDSDGTERERFIMSDFERAFTSPYGASIGQKFTEQYRMDAAICKLVSHCFYERNNVSLVTSFSRKSNFNSDLNPPNFLCKTITWIDTTLETCASETQLEDETTYFNEAEVQAVIHLLELLSQDEKLIKQLNDTDEETPIGVICMYSKQKAKIDMAWARHSWDSKFRRLVRIDTVDSYQGKENSIVILSLVRNNHHRSEGHVSSPNRCNVAVSRAKEKLFIIGAKKMWQSVKDDSPMKRVLNYILSDVDSCKIVEARELR